MLGVFPGNQCTQLGSVMVLHTWAQKVPGRKCLGPMMYLLFDYMDPEGLVRIAWRTGLGRFQLGSGTAVCHLSDIGDWQTGLG